MTKQEDFAQRMSNELFIMRAEDDFTCGESIPDTYRDKILDDPEHIAKMKKLIYDAVLEGVTECPQLYKTDEEGNFIYSSDCYDYCFTVDNYIQDLFDAERDARLVIKYKIWVEIERIEYDPETQEEEYLETDSPMGICYRRSMEDAVAVQTEIANAFGEQLYPLDDKDEDGVPVQCPVCYSDDTRKDFDNPTTMRCCERCGSDWNVDGDILLNGRAVV